MIISLVSRRAVRRWVVNAAVSGLHRRRLSGHFFSRQRVALAYRLAKLTEEALRQVWRLAPEAILPKALEAEEWETTFLGHSHERR